MNVTRYSCIGSDMYGFRHLTRYINISLYIFAQTYVFTCSIVPMCKCLCGYLQNSLARVKRQGNRKADSFEIN